MKKLFITLRRNATRYNNVRSYVENSPDCTLIDAVDARDFSHEDLLEFVQEDRRSWKNYFRPGAICCAMSHLKAYQNLLSSSDAGALIFEDDINTDDLCKVNIFCNSQQQIFDAFDILLFNAHSIKKVFVPLAHRSKDAVVGRVRETTPVGSGLAYYINRCAAETITRSNTPLSCTADEWAHFAKAGVRIGLVHPNLANPRHFSSSIDYGASARSNLLRPLFGTVRPLYVRARFALQKSNIRVVEQTRIPVR